MDKFLFTDTTGKKSVTATVFILGFLVVNAKLLLAGLTVGTVVFSAFTGVDYAAAIGALGAIYVTRRATDKSEGADK